MPPAFFAHLDVDGNGTLSPSEFESRSLPAAPELFADSDQDGAVTRQEALAHAQELASRFDLNGDGILSPDELGAPPQSALRHRNLRVR